MPIYEYACEACGHKFEKLMKIGAEPPACTSCGAVGVKKLVSASAFVLKGSGWYKDHYGLKKGGESGGAKLPASDSKSESKSDSRSEGKPAAASGAESKSAPTPAPAAPAASPKAGGGSPGKASS